MNRIDDVFKDDRKRTYLNAEGADRPLKSPVPAEVEHRALHYRLGRLRAELKKHDCAAALLYDPINIRYALGSSNMQVWTAHNPTRYALVFAEGPAILYDYKGTEHLSAHLDTIDEIRPAVTWMFMIRGERVEEYLALWADQIADDLRTHGGGTMRLACDKLDAPGIFALQARGIACIEGTEITEMARAVKSADEITLMRWTIRVCEAGMARIYEHSLPGATERELWAHLHFENARSGGDWLETKILSCGPRTNPWYQECSDRACGRGEMISFDTDMIGPYGYCADLSRSWTCGYTRMTPQQAGLYGVAREQIETNLALIRPGMDFAEFVAKQWQVPERYQAGAYSLAIHGVGMADEWPVIPLPMGAAHAHGGRFEPGMTVCVESLVAEPGTESIKLETQVLVTETGAERLDSFPWEEP